LTNSYLTNLYSQGTINKIEIDILKKLLNKYSPKTFDMGLVHGDYCPENIVIKDNEDICIIDNENLSIDCLDYDLARTFYRWSMDVYQKNAFLKGYELYRSAKNYNSHCYFWDLRVLTKSILHRTRAISQSVSIPINKLKSIITDV